MSTTMMPNISLPTFDVTLVNPDATAVSTTLGSLLAKSTKGLIVYFYPKDNTAGCTTQAQDFSRLHDEFTKLGYCIVGVSRDSVKSHQNFISKQALNIPLISDPDETLCRHFDVIKQKMMYGKTHMGIVRSTFVFDKVGQLSHYFGKVKAAGHQDALLEQLAQPNA